MIGTSVDYHFRPDRNWRPYLSVGVEWQNRFLPDPIRVYEPNGAFQVHEPWPEAGRNRTFFTAAFGMERRLSRHWSFVAELATTSPEREAVFSFNGLNWQSASSGGYLELGVGLSFNFGGRGDPKAKSLAP